jgi:hypothetical protein
MCSPVEGINLVRMTGLAGSVTHVAISRMALCVFCRSGLGSACFNWIIPAPLLAQQCGQRQNKDDRESSIRVSRARH